MNGYIKIHRKLQEWEWYKKSAAVHLFVHLIFKANFKDSRFEGYDIPRGSFVAGRKVLSDETGLSERTVRTFIKKLIETKEITVKTTNRFSIITICNYCNYQDKEIESDQQPTNNRPTSDQQVTTSEEVKKVRSKIYTQDFETFWKEYPKLKDKGHAFKSWLIQIKTTEPEIIIAGAKRYAIECQGKEEQYIKMAQGWLTGQRWLDETAKQTAIHPTRILQ
jgi:hypothetical protein